MPFHFEYQDLGTIGLLIFLEGILSIDNAVVLALLAGKLPKDQQKRALTYGILGAVAFRIIALGLASQLMTWNWVKFVGGGYLLYVGVSHWFTSEESKNKDKNSGGQISFWKTVVTIELMDLAFAVDSILAAVAISDKLWVVFTGGVIGLIMMRFAATMFIRLLEVFPSFEDSAYILVVLIGSKLVIDGFKFPSVDFHSSQSPASWIFWFSMLAAIGVGFIKKRRPKKMIEMLHKEEESADQA